MKKFIFLTLVFSLLAIPTFGATLVVTKTADTNDGKCDTDCSLREAIAVAVSGDVVTFAPGAQGIHQIKIAALTPAHDGITMDGGAEHKVIIRGNGTIDPQSGAISPEGYNCFTLTTSNNTIKGLVLQNCATGVFILGKSKELGGGKYECTAPKGNRIENNLIGTNEKGDAPAPNMYGVYIEGGQENIVGPKNVISGNTYYGVALSSVCTSLNRVEGNIVGLKADGAAALRNGRYGIVLQLATKANTIGGNTEEARNIISGNNWAGVLMVYGASQNSVEGNYIGTDITGKNAISNSYGIMIGQKNSGGYQTNNNKIRGNLLSGQTYGLVIRGDVNLGNAGAENNVVEKNIIGLAADKTPLKFLQRGVIDVGNFEHGIFISANQNILGSDALENANIIAQNGVNGIFINTNSKGNLIKLNSIYENLEDGIKFANASVHQGILKLAQFSLTDTPQMGEVKPAESDILYISGKDAKPNAKVDLYQADTAQSCEGKTFIGTKTADANGQWEFTLKEKFNDPGVLITALQTAPDIGSSEFSPCTLVENIPPKLAALDDRGITEGQILTFVLKGVDVNGDPLQYSCVKDCPEGMTVNAQTGEVSWTPKKGEGGKTFSSSFSVSDGVGADEKKTNILVEKIDTTPQISVPENKTVKENEEVKFNVSAVDEDGDTVQLVLAQGLKEGMQFQNGAFSWTPKKEDAGEHLLVFRAVDNDKEILFTEKVVQILVKSKPPPPKIDLGGDKIVNAGRALSLSATLTEKSEEVQYTYKWSVNEGGGTIVNETSPEAKYLAPKVDDDTDEAVTLEISDSEGNTASQSIIVTVLGKTVSIAKASPVASSAPAAENFAEGSVSEGVRGGEEFLPAEGGEVSESDGTKGKKKTDEAASCQLKPGQGSAKNYYTILFFPLLLILLRLSKRLSESKKYFFNSDRV